MQSTILVVDDGRELATIYAMWVGEDEEVATAYDGRSDDPDGHDRTCERASDPATPTSIGPLA